MYSATYYANLLELVGVTFVVIDYTISAVLPTHTEEIGLLSENSYLETEYSYCIVSWFSSVLQH
jgi:hypothetical protein